MPSKRPSRPLLPEDFRKLFPDDGSFEAFQRMWPAIERRRGVKPDEILNALRQIHDLAAVHTTIEDLLNRLEFPERAGRIRRLLGKLAEEIQEFLGADQAVLMGFFAALRNLPTDGSSDPILRAHRALAESLESALSTFDRYLRRPQGHQPRPEIPLVIQFLHAKGLRLAEAETILGLMGLIRSRDAKKHR